MSQRNGSNPNSRIIKKPRWFSLTTYIRAHIQAAKSSFERLYRTPFASIMTICVIGVALALPSGFLVLLNSAKSIYQGIDESTQISLYLHQSTSPQQINDLMTKLKLRSDVGSVRYISPENGLAEFTKSSGFADVIKQLPDNPLPPVIEVFPATSLRSPALIENLLESMQQLPEVEIAKLDMQWIKRLRGILDLGQHAVIALLLLFFVAVVLVIGNTIRLATQNQHTEIEVIKLIGGTNAFVRRPFLYTGLYYGLFGGMMACLLVGCLVLSLNRPVMQLALLYDSHFSLIGMSFQHIFGSLLVSMGLGAIGAWLAVSQQLSEYDPL